MAAKPGAKGYDLEEALRRFFLDANFFVLRGVPYRLEGEDVTDVDLWLYERPAASTRRRMIVDIKNKKSPKAAERIVWTKGLQAALNMDGAMVATTDRRPATRRLARSLGVTLLDGDPITKAMQAVEGPATLLTSTEFDEVVKRVDTARKTTEWRQILRDARGAMLTSLGVASANTALQSQGFLASQVIEAHPNSAAAEAGTRLVYLMAALAVVSLDYITADYVFRGPNERRAAIVSSIRFGQPDPSTGIPTVRAAIALARKYVENGQAIAKQIEYGFRSDAERIPAEIIADFVQRNGEAGALFELARELEFESSRRALRSYDQLTTAAKAALGAFLDFNGVSRPRFATAWGGGSNTAGSVTPLGQPAQEAGVTDLFEGEVHRPAGTPSQ